MARVEVAKETSWREANGMQADEGFAFAFTSYLEATALAGRGVADRWHIVRAGQMAWIGHEAKTARRAEAAAQQQARRATLTPRIADPVTLLPRKGSKRVPSAASTRRTQEPDHASKNSQWQDALVGIMEACGDLLSAGDARTDPTEFRSAYIRRAIAKCESSEPMTLSRAVITWHELGDYL